MQLVINVQKAFGVDLTLQQLFEAPMIQRLGQVIEARLREQRAGAMGDNFIDRGGRPNLLAGLQRRIATKLGRRSNAGVRALFKLNVGLDKLQ